MKNVKEKNPMQKSLLGAKASRRLSNGVIYAILVVMTLVWLFPFFGIMLESFRVETRMQVGYLWPEQFGFDNYIRLFKETDFLNWFKNTAIMGDEGLGERLEMLFHDRTGAEVHLEERVNPDIIGGFVFELDGYRLDASVESHLERLRRQLIEKNNRIV